MFEERPEIYNPIDDGWFDDDEPIDSEFGDYEYLPEEEF